MAAARMAEAELAVQAVRVAGVQHPALPWTVLDHRGHDGPAQSGAAVLRQHVHVGEVGGPAVANARAKPTMAPAWS